jgi:tetratricopeptide (TPR) repeat protein
MLRIACAAVISAITVNAFAQTPFELANQWYAKRAENAQGLIAAAGPVDKAIADYRAALSGANGLEATIGLLKSLYFKGTFTSLDKKTKQAIFEEAKEIGEQAVSKYPGNPGLRYWLAVEWGRWGEVYGILNAAREGAAGKMREHLESSIAANPRYDDGLAYAVLGRLHHQAPNIPLILGWPSKKESEKFLRKSLEMSPTSTLRNYYLGHLLYDLGRKDEARQVLQKGIQLIPRADNIIEDGTDLQKMKDLLAKL